MSGILISVSALQFFYKLKCSNEDSHIPTQCAWFSSIIETNKKEANYEVDKVESQVLSSSLNNLSSTSPQHSYQIDVANRLPIIFYTSCIDLLCKQNLDRISASGFAFANRIFIAGVRTSWYSFAQCTENSWETKCCC